MFNLIIRKKKNKNFLKKIPFCSKCWNWKFWTYFFTEIHVFVVTQSKVPKQKGTIGYLYRISGTDTGTVLVQMWTVPNPTYSASIHCASLIPHFVTLQPYSKMDQNNYFPQNSTNNTPWWQRERSLFEIFANVLKNYKWKKNHMYISFHSLCHDTQNWAQLHPAFQRCFYNLMEVHLWLGLWR